MKWLTVSWGVIYYTHIFYTPDFVSAFWGWCALAGFIQQWPPGQTEVIWNRSVRWHGYELASTCLTPWFWPRKGWTATATGWGWVIVSSGGVQEWNRNRACDWQADWWSICSIADSVPICFSEETVVREGEAVNLPVHLRSCPPL